MPRSEDLVRLFHIDRQLQASGMRPLQPEELQKAYHGLPPAGQTRVQGDQVTPPSMTMGDPRDAMFRSNVPMGQSLGPVINPMQRQGQGATGMTGLYDDPAQLPIQRYPIVSLAGGGVIKQPSWAMVGERGPEMALLQKGSMVMPNLGGRMGQGMRPSMP